MHRRQLVKRLGMGIVGAGFVGPPHVDAVRRLGYVDVVAIAGSSAASARKKADALGIERSYGSYEALLDDPAVQVVHNTTPNYLHYPVNAAALARGKHVISDKPLAMTAAEARKLLDQATKAGVVHAVTFNYRGNPLVQQARLSIARGDIGRPHFLIGQYLQDWLLKDTDYSWRLEPDKGASSVGQVCAGHKNDLILEISGSKASLRWTQEQQNDLWIGHRDKANELLQKDPSLIDAEARGYAHLPGGHQESWTDAFANLMRDIYGFIAAGKKPSDPHPPAFATFEDGYRANCIVEAILESAKKGSVWTKVSY